MTVERRVFLGIVRVGEMLSHRMGEALEPYRLTLGQYAIIEALREAGADGLACGEIADRMLTRDPDVTRLLDRLEDRGLVSRFRARPDRRVVRTQLTTTGVSLAAELDMLVRALQSDYLRRLGRRDLSALEDLLDSTETAVLATMRRRVDASA